MRTPSCLRSSMATRSWIRPSHADVMCRPASACLDALPVAQPLPWMTNADLRSALRFHFPVIPPDAVRVHCFFHCYLQARPITR
jgi:hypothetical protein